MGLVGEIGQKLEFEDAKLVGALHGFSPAQIEDPTWEAKRLRKMTEANNKMEMFMETRTVVHNTSP